jgi:hypothetical protein
MQKPGGFGIGRGAYSLLINETILIMVGRSKKLSCTQKSPMLTNGTPIPLPKIIIIKYYFRLKK